MITSFAVFEFSYFILRVGTFSLVFRIFLECGRRCEWVQDEFIQIRPSPSSPSPPPSPTFLSLFLPSGRGMVQFRLCSCRDLLPEVFQREQALEDDASQVFFSRYLKYVVWNFHSPVIINYNEEAACLQSLFSSRQGSMRILLEIFEFLVFFLSLSIYFFKSLIAVEKKSRRLTSYFESIKWSKKRSINLLNYSPLFSCERS